MIRFFLLFLILQSTLFGCALCSVFTPRTHITTNIVSNENRLTKIDIKWDFAKEFADELKQIYDLNENNTFDEKELEVIQETLVDYLITRDFITTIYYDNKKDKNSINFEVDSYKMSFNKGILEFDYTIYLDLPLFNENYLTIRIFDKEGFFFIIFEDKNQKFDTKYKFKKDTNISEVSYFIKDANLPKQKFAVNLEKTENKEQNLYETWTQNKELETETNSETNSLKPKEDDLSFISKSTNNFTSSIKNYLVNIEQNRDFYSLVLLCMASFLYGFIHSLGPGHGKALAFSYFSSQKSSYTQAFVISFLTAFVHIIGALILVVFATFIFGNILDSFVDNSIVYITAFSAVIIMILSLYILYKKINKKSCSCCSCSTDFKSSKFEVVENKNYVFVNKVHKIHSPKRDKKQDLIFVLTAGIIPCAGTVLLFIYAFLLKTYFAVILATIFISLGMATVIFASSFLGVSLHKISSKSKKLIDIVEIIAPIFMFVLALILLLNVDVFK